MPGIHWAWDSVGRHLMKVAALGILSGLYPKKDVLSYRTREESLLVQCRELPLATGDFAKCSGSYVVIDSSRGIHIRAGQTDCIERRWKEHGNCAMLKKESDRRSKLYCSYPHDEADKENLFVKPRGAFRDLHCGVGIAFKGRSKKQVVELFDWDDTEEQHLSQLSGSDSLVDKKAKHISYMFELLLALSIGPENNISRNPGMEWQLQYFGK